jgi:hypothetical protein
MAKAIILSGDHIAWVDDDDFALVSQFKWSATNCAKDGCEKWYAMRKVRGPDGRRRTQYLHRFLMGEPPLFVVDHQDADGLNCRRMNLIVTTQSINAKRRGMAISRPSGAVV